VKEGVFVYVCIWYVCVCMYIVYHPHNYSDTPDVRGVKQIKISQESVFVYVCIWYVCVCMYIVYHPHTYSDAPDIRGVEQIKISPTILIWNPSIIRLERSYIDALCSGWHRGFLLLKPILNSQSSSACVQ